MAQRETGRNRIAAAALAAALIGFPANRALADGSAQVAPTISGCVDVVTFGVGLYGDGEGGVTIAAPGPIVAVFIDWVGVEDQTPPTPGTSTLSINGTDVIGTLVPGAAGHAASITPNWYAWHADIGPTGLGIANESPTMLKISGWDSASDETNGASVTVVYELAKDCLVDHTIRTLSGVDYYWEGMPAERFSELLVFEFEPDTHERIASVCFSHAGTAGAQVSCRGGAIWMLAGSGPAPAPSDFDLVALGPGGRGIGTNGGVEIVNDPFTGPALPCTPRINPTPDAAYAPGHPHSGGAAGAPYRAVSITPGGGGFVGNEWSTTEVSVLVPAGANWAAFQLESEDDQHGESGSWTGGTGLLLPTFTSPVIACPPPVTLEADADCSALLPDLTTDLELLAAPLIAVLVQLDESNQGAGNQGHSVVPISMHGGPAPLTITARTLVDPLASFDPLATGQPGTVHFGSNGAGVQNDRSVGSITIEGAGASADEELTFTFQRPAPGGSLRLGLSGFTPGTGRGNQDDPYLFIDREGAGTLVVSESQFLPAWFPTGPGRGFVDFSLLGLGNAAVEALTVRETNGALLVDFLTFMAPTDLDLLQDPPAGTLLGPGETLVTITASAPSSPKFVICPVVVSVVDRSGPRVTPPPDAKIACGTSPDPSITGHASAIDNCDKAVVVEYEDALQSGPCGSAAVILRTWRATDTLGNTATAPQIITLSDEQPPVVTPPVGVTVKCDSSTGPERTGTASAVDGCDPHPQIGFTDQMTPGDCAGAWTIVRTWTGTDACGNVGSAVQSIRVIDTIPPVLTLPLNRVIECDEASDPAGTGWATVTDNCDLDPVLRWVDEIAGPGLQQCPQDLVIRRTWIASDDCGNSVSLLQIITIHDTAGPIVTAPPSVTIQCGQSSSPSSTGQAQVTDNCDSTPTISHSDSIAPGSCPQAKVITRTWTVQDNCQNFASAVQTITVVDSTPPVITAPPGASIQCNSAPVPGLTGQATASDNCDTSPTITYADQVGAGGCSGAIVRTWAATDDCGNSASAAQVIQVLDTTPPALTIPANVTVDCDGSKDPARTGFASAVDACDPKPVVGHNDTIVPGTCAGTWSIVRTWSAADGCGNSTIGVQTIAVIDTVPPVLTLPGSVIIDCDDSSDPAGTGWATVVDNCDPQPSLRWVDEISGPGLQQCPQSLVIRRTWIATDACNNSVSLLQVITIRDTESPNITPPADRTIECGQSTAPANTGQPQIADACDPNPTVTWSDSIAQGACPQEMLITRTWTVHDSCNNLATAVQTIWMRDTTPPFVSPPPDAAVECDSVPGPQVTGAATATDPCDPAPQITYADDLSGAAGCAGTIRRTWTATDACGNSASAVQIITTSDHTPPVLTLPDDASLECGASTEPGATGHATATDGCDPAPMISFADAGAGPDGCSGTGVILRTWTAVDECGNAASAVQTIHLLDTGDPVLVVPADLTIGCHEPTDPARTGEGSATDTCDQTPQVVYQDDLSGLQGCGATGVIVRTWTATDACGNTTSGQQQIGVVDAVPPALTLPADREIACTDPLTPSFTGQAQGSDACDAAPVVDYTDTVAPGACTLERVITRTWTATDACGNAQSGIQRISVRDRLAPSLALPADVTIECGAGMGPSSTGHASALDDCDPAPQVTFTDDDSGLSGCQGTRLRTWTAIDACGNARSAVQRITVADTQAPALKLPADLTIGCHEPTDPSRTGSASASDACDPAPALTHNDDRSALSGCSATGIIRRTWTATDACGNARSALQTITVTDTQPPVIGGCAGGVQAGTNPGACVATFTPQPPQAVDGCDPKPVLAGSRNDGLALGAPYPLGTTTITWVATDACGNAGAPCVQTVTVTDTQAPTVLCPQFPITLTTCGGSALLQLSPQATDNCDTAPLVICNPPAGTPLPLGHAVVTCVAVDKTGNTSAPCAINVMVVEPPMLSLVIVDRECVNPVLNQNFTVELRMSNVAELGKPVAGYQAFVQFDPKKLAFEQGWYTQQLFGLPIINPIQANAQGRISLAAGINVFKGQQPTLQDGVLATLKFAPLQGDCDLERIRFYTGGQPIILTDLTGTPLPGLCLEDSSEILLDGEAPRIVSCCPAVTLAANALCRAPAPNLTGCVVAKDGCVEGNDGFTYTQFPAAGSSLGLGTTWFTITVTDCAGNSAFCQTAVTVVDQTPPVIATCAPNRTLKADNDCLVRVPDLRPQVSATDNCDNPSLLTIVQQPPHNTAIGLGTTVVTLQVLDDAGNAASCTATLTVLDSTPPKIAICPNDAQLKADASCRAALSDFRGNIVAVDNCTWPSKLIIEQNPPAGTSLPKGTTPVLITVTDEVGLSDTCTVQVSVVDNTPPQITFCPGNVTLPLDANCGATMADFRGQVVATDNCDADLTITQSNAPGSPLLGPGTLEVTLTVTDQSGNATSCALVVTTVDQTPPTILTCAPPQKLVGNASCQAKLPQLTGSVVASDNCSNSFTITQQPPAGTTIGAGVTVVTITVKDGAGNSATCQTQVTVGDQTNPVITCPANITVACAGPDGAVVSFVVSATDNCDTTPQVTCVRLNNAGQVVGAVNPAGQLFPIGQTNVVCQAIDDSGNSAQCLFSVTVRDTVAPLAVCPPSLTVTAGAQCGGVIPDLRSQVQVSDLCSTFSINQSPPAGTLIFGFGKSIVTFYVTDASGNTTSCKTQLVLVDNTPPVILNCPQPLKLFANSKCRANVPNFLLGFQAVDSCSNQVIKTQSPAPGTLVGTGPTTVVFTATDQFGNSAQCQTTFFVSDATPPKIWQCAPNTTLKAGPTCTAPAPDLRSTVVASDDCTQASALVRTQTPAPGTPLPLGTTHVVIGVKDAVGNTDTCKAIVTVVDSTPPVISCPVNITVAAPADTCAAVVQLGQAKATDNCSQPKPYAQRHDGKPLTAPYPLGVSIITWSATDPSGNATTCQQTVTVVDQTPPQLTCPPNISKNASPGLCTAQIDPGTATARDNCDQNLNLSVQRSDGLDLDDPYPVGVTHITWTATDDAGHVSTCVQTVAVQGQNTVLVDIDLSPTVISGPLVRCIRFRFFDACGGAGALEVEQDVTFVNGSARNVPVKINCGVYTCVAASDPLHTLRRTAPLESVKGKHYRADFTAQRALVGGNLNGDGTIDILDFATFASRFLSVYTTGNTPCGNPYHPQTNPHADINGNGIVFIEDYPFVSANFGKTSEALCCTKNPGGIGGVAAEEPLARESITVAELRLRGRADLAAADLNRDGTVDRSDLLAFATGPMNSADRAFAGEGAWSDAARWSGSAPDEASDVLIAGRALVDGSALAREIRVVAGGELVLVDEGSSIRSRSLLFEPDARLVWDAGTIEIAGGRFEPVDQDLLLGLRPAASALHLFDGAMATVERHVSIGMHPQSRCLIEVDGPATALRLGGTITVGFAGQGTLSITGGGLVSSSEAIVGHGPSARGEVFLDGAQSIWLVDGTLIVGAAGSAALEVSDGATAAAAMIHVGPGGRLSGDGTLEASAIMNEGRIDPGFAASGATLVLVGDLVQNGILEIDLGSALDARPLDHDAVRVQGHAALGGTLLLRWPDGGAPRVGTEIVILRAESIEGGFAAVRNPRLPDGTALETLYLPESVLVRIVRAGGLGAR